MGVIVHSMGMRKMKKFLKNTDREKSLLHGRTAAVAVAIAGAGAGAGVAAGADRPVNTGILTEQYKALPYATLSP